MVVCNNMIKSNLYEVSVIRPLLIFCIVVGHSFAPFSGSWKSFGVDISMYEWINPFFISFQLGCFVLISGYLYKHVSIKPISWGDFVWKKIKRLIIPCVFFGLIYYLLVGEQNPNLSELIYQILQGYGHLWFLPMLFWCFIFAFFIDRFLCFYFSKRTIFIFLVVVTLIPFPIPFGIGNALHYVVYFYLGMVLYDKKNTVIEWNKNYINLLFLFYLLSTVFLKIMCRDYLFSHIDMYGIYSKIAVIVTANAIQMLIILSGSLSLYATVMRVINRKHNNNIVFMCSKLSYGIYIFHQIVLMYLYYNTPLSRCISVCLIPWIGLILSLTVSSICAYYLLKTKIGIFLIG